MYLCRKHINGEPGEESQLLPPVATLFTPSSSYVDSVELLNPGESIQDHDQVDELNPGNVEITYCGTFTAPAVGFIKPSSNSANYDNITLQGVCEGLFVDTPDLNYSSVLCHNSPFIILQQPLPTLLEEGPTNGGHQALYTLEVDSNEHNSREPDEQLLLAVENNNSGLTLLSPASTLSSEDVGYASASLTPPLDTSEGDRASLDSLGEREGVDELNQVYHLDDGTEVVLTTADDESLGRCVPDEEQETALGKGGRRNRGVGRKSDRKENDR